MPLPDPAKANRRDFLGRLAYLLTGLAIGFMVLGFFQAAKQHQSQVDEEHRQQLLASPPPTDNLFPPLPKSEAPAPAPAQPAAK
jgi:hypothetical protein